MKRCIAFCLALGAALSLTACGGGDTEGGLLCEASGIRPDTVLLSVDGRDVSAQRYLYWLAYACDYIADYYDSGEGIQWGDTVSGQSLEDYAKDQALQNAALYATVETWAEDYGCTLTDEDRTAGVGGPGGPVRRGGGLSGRAGPHGAGPGGSGGHLRGLLSLRAPVRPLLHGGQRAGPRGA